MKFDTKSILLTLCSSILFAFCILCFIYAGLGSDSITVFEEGLSKFFSMSIGSAINCYNFTVIILVLLLSRDKMGWATILNAIVIGSIVNIIEPLIKPILLLSSGIPFRIILFILGELICAIACALLIISGAGMSAIDALSYVVAHIFNIEFKYGRILIDAFLMLAGYLMGGIVGIGSILTIILTGPLISYFVELFKRNGQI